MARTRRALDSGADASEVLAAAGLTEARWEELEEEVMSALADDVDRGDSTRLEAYRVAYAAGSEGALAAAAQPAPSTPSASSSVEDAPAVSPQPSKASYQRVPIPAARISPDDTAQVDVRNIVAGIRAAAGPFDASAPVCKPMPATIARPEDQSGSTMTADISELLKGPAAAVPFSARPGPLPAPAPAPPTQARSSSVATEVVDFEEVQKMLAKGPTPFAEAAGASERPASVATEAIDLEAIQKILGTGPTPFSGTAAAPPSLPVRPPETSPRAYSVPTEEVTLASADPLPFEQKAQPGPMTLGRYAQIQAAIRTDPDPGSVLGRFGVSLQDWGAAHSEMRARFKADPALREKYEQLLREATQ